MLVHGSLHKVSCSSSLSIFMYLDHGFGRTFIKTRAGRLIKESDRQEGFEVADRLPLSPLA